MSTVPPAPAPVPPPAPAPIQSAKTNEIIVYHHSSLFYWWPVWVVGFIMALTCVFSGHRLIVVPNGSVLDKQKVNVPGENKLSERWVVIAPESDKIDGKENSNEPETYLRTTDSKRVGVIFCIVLLLVIAITNIPLRGLWSVVIIVFVVLMSVILALARWWDPIFRAIGLLDIHINAAGYVFLSTSLLIMWITSVFVFDKQVYMIFGPGYMRVCEEIGGGERVYSTAGMTLEKQQSDIFRHWIIGLGSGDLVVRTTGAQAHHFELRNVLFVSNKLSRIETLIKEQVVVPGVTQVPT